MTVWIMQCNCHDVMGKPILFILLVLAPLQGIVVAAGRNLIPDEQRLYERIMGNYVRAVKPVVRDDFPLQVLFSIRLKQIVDLDERQQVLTTNVFIDQTWIDSALAWNATEFSDVTSLRIPADQIWKPDTFIYNNADNGSTGFISGKFIQIHHNGAVTWPVPVRLRSSCVVKIAYFPFDYQQCLVRFGSWIYSHQFMDYKIRPDAVSVDLATYVNNSEWELLSMTMEKNTNQRARSSNIHPFLTMTIYLRRNTFFYLFNIIVPCIMLSMLTLMTFWLPPTSGEKVTLGLSVFLAFSMFMLLIADEVPASSDAVPIIGIYLCVVMTMTSLSVILAVLVTNLYYRGTKLRAAPRWFAHLFIRVLAPPMCVSRNVELLATTIIVPEHCRFFLIHNKFDFPNCNINSYHKYNRNKPQSPETKPKQKRNSRIGPVEEGQRYVFDQHDSQNRWNHHSYTSGKRSRHAHQSDNTTHIPQRRMSFREHNAEYTTVRCVNSEEPEDLCNSESDLDENEKNLNQKTDPHIHCNLQHSCDTSNSSRKGVPPFFNRFFNTKQQRQQQNSNQETQNNFQILPQSHAHNNTINDSLSCNDDESSVHVVQADMSPAGATVTKTFPFTSLNPPLSFGVIPEQYTSPIKRRRKLIKNVKDYNETKSHFKILDHSFHENKTFEYSSSTDLFSSSRLHDKARSKRRRIHNKKSITNGIAQRYPLSDHSVSMNDLRLQDISLGNHQYSPSALSKIGNTNKRKSNLSSTSACMIYNTNVPFDTEQTTDDHLHQMSSKLLLSSSSWCNLKHSPGFSNKQTTDNSKSAKLQALPMRENLLVAEDTFCQCSDSQEDVWVPYDVLENSEPDEVWCLRDDFHPYTDNSHRVDNDRSNYEETAATTSVLHPHVMEHTDGNQLYTASNRRAKSRNSLRQRNVEQFMDERSKLILAKARLIMAEWQTMAAVIDRLLFLIALLATIFAYVFLLVIVPNEHSLDSFINSSHTLPTSTGKYDWEYA